MLNLLALIAKIPTTVLVFGIVVIVMSVFLIIAVLMQQGKQHNLSGTIAGAADTFFGKSKGQTISNKLSILTSVVAVIFVIIVLAFYIQQTPNEKIFSKTPAQTEAAAENADAAEDAVDDAADAVSDAAEDAADAVSDAAEDAADAVSDAVEDAADAVSDAVEDAADAVSDAVEDAGN